MRCLTVIFLLLTLLCCSTDRTNRNPYLQEIRFRIDLNLNLPLYSPLTNTGNAVYANTNVNGSKGIFVMNVGFNQYRAFEAGCPNHAPSSCSTLTLDGQKGVCPCEGYEYSLFTGQQFNRPNDGNRYYDLLEYRTTFSGNVVSVSN